jgi:hypothetical protein
VAIYNNMEVPQKTEIYLPYNPPISLMIHIQRKLNQHSKDIPMFTAELFTTAKTWNRPRLPQTSEPCRHFTP